MSMPGIPKGLIDLSCLLEILFIATRVVEIVEFRGAFSSSDQMDDCIIASVP